MKGRNQSRALTGPIPGLFQDNVLCGDTQNFSQRIAHSVPEMRVVLKEGAVNGNGTSV